MRELTELRQELDALDRQIVAAFEQRMNIAREVADWKKANGKPVLDTSREEQVLDAREKMLSNPEYAPAVRALYTELMRLSREEQAKRV